MATWLGKEVLPCQPVWSRGLYQDTPPGRRAVSRIGKPWDRSAITRAERKEEPAESSGDMRAAGKFRGSESREEKVDRGERSVTGRVFRFGSPISFLFSPLCSPQANWGRSDLNREPKDYAYHFGFRRPFRVCGLDYTFPLQAGRLVSTPSPVGRGLARYWLSVLATASTEFDRFYWLPASIWRPATQHRMTMHV